MSKITIEVTKEDIKKGVKGEATSCAIARAAKRQGLRFVCVAADTKGKDAVFAFKAKEKHYAGILPKSIAKWIDRFDAGDPVEPITVNVAVKEMSTEEFNHWRTI